MTLSFEVALNAVGFPLSVAITVNEYVDIVSKSKGFLHVMIPVELPISNLQENQYSSAPHIRNNIFNLRSDMFLIR